MLSLLCLTLSEPETAKKILASQDELLESAISRLANGDKDALGDLYENARVSVYSFALSIVKNTQDAEDVMHDTFVAVYKHAKSYTPKGKPLAWILTIAKNFALKALRHRGRFSSEEEDWERYNDQTNDEAEQGEKRLVLIELLKTLSEQERQIITLHAVSGLKHRQIAELLDLPLSTVLSKYNRAIKKLRNELQEDASDV